MITFVGAKLDPFRFSKWKQLCCYNLFYFVGPVLNKLTFLFFIADEQVSLKYQTETLTDDSS